MLLTWPLLNCKPFFVIKVRPASLGGFGCKNAVSGQQAICQGNTRGQLCTNTVYKWRQRTRQMSSFSFALPCVWEASQYFPIFWILHTTPQGTVYIMYCTYSICTYSIVLWGNTVTFTMQTLPLGPQSSLHTYTEQNDYICLLLFLYIYPMFWDFSIIKTNLIFIDLKAKDNGQQF